VSQALLRQATRLALYRQDFSRFAKDQLKITTKIPGSPIKAFHLYSYQQLLWEYTREQRARQGWVRQLWLKGRQAGFSTLAQGIVFWRTILNPNVNSLVVAHDAETTHAIFSMAHRFYDHLDPALKPMKRYSTKAELVFDNPNDRERTTLRGLNSRIVVATARNIHSGAGTTLHNIHLSEAARYLNAVEIESAALQAVSFQPDTYVIIESTARPEGHWFREMCDEARAGRSHYEFHFVPWIDDKTCWAPIAVGEDFEPTPEERELAGQYELQPEQLKWRRMKLAEKRGNLDEFSMDYPLTYEEAWIMREFEVFPRHQLRLCYPGLRPPAYRAQLFAREPKPLHAHNGPLAIWEDPLPQASYDIGVDVALGIGQDFSAAMVLKRPTGEQVAEFHSNGVEPGEFSDMLDSLGRYYNTAQIAVEVNGPGLYTNERLGINYPNLYIWRRTDKIKQRLSNFFGWESSEKTKQQLVALAKDRLYRYATTDAHQRFPLVRSNALFEEMQGFVQEPGTDRYNAGPGYHDDLVMAWMIAMKSSSDEFGIEMESTAAAPTAPVQHYPGCTCRSCEPRLYLSDREQPFVTVSDGDIWDVTGWRS
jgi:hypothetical protein